jgi:DNA-binding HxlR family transcriptional regulator
MLPLGAVEREPIARVYRAWTPLARALAATGDHWTVLIVLALGPGRMRLKNLQRTLPGVSIGVLERHLEQMVALQLVTRQRFKEMPPRVELELTDAGRELLEPAGLLARWGMRNRWSDPEAHEHVDVGALLRMVPALLEERDDLPGHATIEALVDGVIPPVRLIYEVSDGHLQIAQHQTTEATATVRGDERAWVAALGPAADYGALEFNGEPRIARELLEALPREITPAQPDPG